MNGKLLRGISGDSICCQGIVRSEGGGISSADGLRLRPSKVVAIICQRHDEAHMAGQFGHSGLRIKDNICPCQGQRYIDKLNKLSISNYLYAHSYGNIVLNTPCILVRVMFTSFLHYLLTTSVAL